MMPGIFVQEDPETGEGGYDFYVLPDGGSREVGDDSRVETLRVTGRKSAAYEVKNWREWRREWTESVAKEQKEPPPILLSIN